VRQLSSSGRSKKRKKKAKVTVVQPSVSTADDEDYEETDSPGLLAEIGTKIANQATVVLIDLARQKLMEFLESRKKEE